MTGNVVALLLLLTCGSAEAQDKYEKFAVFVTGPGDAAPVARSLTKLLNESKPFQAVGKNDDSKVVVLVSCMDRKQTEAYGCMYVSHYNGVSFKTFMGAGMFVARDADAVAKNFLSSIAADIVERYNDTSTTT